MLGFTGAQTLPMYLTRYSEFPTVANHWRKPERSSPGAFLNVYRNAHESSLIEKKKNNCLTYYVTVHGGWSQWGESDSSTCSKTCGSGCHSVDETRSCTNPRPSGKGAKSCSGVSKRTKIVSCNTQSCPGKHNFGNNCNPQSCP